MSCQNFRSILTQDVRMDLWPLSVCYLNDDDDDWWNRRFKTNIYVEEEESNVHTARLYMGGGGNARLWFKLPPHCFRLIKSDCKRKENWKEPDVKKYQMKKEREKSFSPFCNFLDFGCWHQLEQNFPHHERLRLKMCLWFSFQVIVGESSNHLQKLSQMFQ